MSAAINLIVLRSPEPERLATFYSALGLLFEKHRHGSGPEHYGCEAGSVVFEIYPCAQNAPGTTATRIGFSVEEVDATVEQLMTAGASLVSAPKPSPWGRRAVLDDPDGHRVELTESKA